MESSQLAEELKTTLEPNLISSLKGNFKTGKRLNLKKLIPYVASNFRKNKIWLRRTLPDKRNYQIMIALDNSLSMREQEVGILALQSLAVLGTALSKLEIQDLLIGKITNTLEVLLSQDDQFSQEKCQEIMEAFDFGYEDKNSTDLSMVSFVSKSMKVFENL